LTRLQDARSSDLPHLTEFLENNSLPTVGLRDCLENFLIATDEVDSWVGVAGYELYGKSALLRSVAVDPGARNLGHGHVLVDRVLARAKERGVRTVYLLTETAEAYFRQLGFEAIDRTQVDDAVKKSQEFRGCCISAQAMRKNL